MSQNIIDDLKERAAQLRKPTGALGLTIADLMNQGNALMCSNTYDKLNVEEKDSILEIGMGNGFFVPYLLRKQQHLSYVGLDYSELMVKTATEKNKDAVDAGHVTFIHGKLEALPFQPHTFHRICTSNTLYFWSAPEKSMQGLFKVLKAGGKLLVAIRPKDILNNLPVTEYNFIRYTEEEAKDLMVQAGFQDIQIEIVDEPDRIIEGKPFKLKSSYITGTKPSL